MIAEHRLEGECPQCRFGYVTAIMSPSTTSLPDAFQRKLAQQRAEAVERCGFAVYGLDAWTGHRRLAGWGWAGEIPTSLTLVHGEPESSLRVRVTTSVTPDWRVEEAARELANSLRDDGVDHAALGSTFSESDPMQNWEPVRLMVGAEDQAFWRFPARRSWAAVGQVGKAVIGIHAGLNHPAGVRLIPITDFEPYLVTLT